ncbi:MAG: protein kinase [Phycisphaerae bacterium]
MPARPKKPDPFDLQPGRVLAGKYLVTGKLGVGTEGEVYAITDRLTGVKRAAKLYYPDKDPKGRAAIAYARKLDALRHCPILLQYYHQEQITLRRQKVNVVVSELVGGQMLYHFLKRQPEGRLSVFEGLVLLHTLAAGLAPIHARGEYHGDIHDENVMIRRKGIGFEVKLLDFHDLGRPSRAKIQKDVLNLMQLFHGTLGGRETYATHPPVIKQIVRGLKDHLILQRFGSAVDIQRHLENLTW